MLYLPQGASCNERLVVSEESALTQYLREIHRLPQMNRTEEAGCARRAAQGDASARDRLIGANLRFVIMVARRYAHLGLSMEDLVSEGNVGLIRAIRSYDPGRGVRVISYAVWWIRQAILRALQENPESASLDAPVPGMDDELTLADLLADEGSRGPEDAAVEEVLCRDVRALLEQLPPGDADPSAALRRGRLQTRLAGGDRRAAAHDPRAHPPDRETGPGPHPLRGGHGQASPGGHGLRTRTPVYPGGPAGVCSGQ